MSAESPRHARSSGGPLLVPSQPPSDRSIIDTVSGFINDVKLTSSSPDQKDTIQWARFETADINEPTPEGDSNDVSPLLLILGYGAGVQVWLIPPNGEAQEVLSWRQGTVRVLRILPTPQYGDSFTSKRPLLSLCDSASPGPPFCSLSFISIRGGEQVKSIKFKNPILDVLANKRSVVVSFSERFAVFDAGTLEDRLAVTTCYPCPCPLGGSAPVNPLALGDRWLAYADKKINPSKRSSGGCEGEGVASYTATVLHAAKSLGKGLRGLGESVAQSLAGGRGASPPHATPPPPQQPGAVTIIDIEGNNEDDSQDSEEPFDPIVAHFVAHSDAIIALQFDASGLLLVTADRRGHDFHVFRIHPHPCGSSLASVHHLYILHRGDTTAKVQDIAISPDSRWAAISTLRGTTHIFAMSPYGGWCGVRTHTSPRVVNRLSRFHRSAGLPIHAASRSGSPVGEGMAGGAWFPNPRLPPYPLPTTGAPLAQLRSTATIPTNTITRNSSGRQRLSSLSEDSNGVPLLARARFGQSVSCSTSGGGRGATSLSLYLLPASGALTHLLLHPRPARSVPKEKICDDSPIEVDVEPASQWPLQRPPTAGDLLAPLPASSPLLQSVSFRRCHDMNEGEEERWLSQVEIVTHAGPHRRLWMGPQFVFKTYNCTGSNSSLSEAETVEVETTAAHSIARSNPVNMPGVRPAVPLLIDSGSASSLEHSPSDSFRKKSLLAESGRAPSVCDVQLREELAEAMKEEQGWSSEARSQPVERRAGAVCIERAVDPLGTVVVPAPGPPPHLEDVDLYTHSNDDEARFRPVVRAPAPTFLPPHADVVVRPLPVGTTIPVQTVTPTTKLTPEDEPLPLNSDVVIPAALTYVQNMRDDCALPADIEGNETEPVKVGSLENKITDDKDLKSEEMNAEPCERKHESESTESVDVKSLPKSNQSVDIQPATRVKKSPTPKLISDKNDNVRIDKGTKYKERKETKCIYENKITAKIADVKVNIQVSANDNDRSKNLLDEIYTETKIKETKELKCSADDEGKKSQLSKISKKNKDIVKSYPKETVDDLSKHKPKEEVNVATQCRQIVEPPLVSHSENQDSSFDDETSTQSNVLPQPKELKINTKVGEEIILKEHETTQNKRINELKEPTIKTDDKISNQGKCEVLPSEDMDMSQSHTILQNADDVKTEDQAWDLLLTDTITSPTVVSKQPTVRDKTFEDIKVKPKKSKKNKKSQEEMAKADEDSFVEIHTIEDKLQENVGDLVALSTDFDDEDTSRTPLPKKKSRSSKSATPESKLEVDTKIGAISFDNLHHEHVSTLSPARKTKTTKKEENDFDLIINPRTYCKIKELQKTSYDFVGRSEGTTSESTSYIEKEMTVPKSRKCKSLSPYPENIRKVSEKADNETAKKDIIVIDSTKDEFPEIQITTFNKTRKKSIQSTEIKEQIVEVVTEKPIKSWSSIAGGSGKKVTEAEKNNLKAESSNTSADVFLHDKLFEICKRTDIMVAQCDAPSELNFIEGHHSVIEDLPPLEPLDFALDGFKLDVMQDSLLDVTDTKVTSPICKINIDDILSSIKETTNKVIESSKFNLVELKQVSVKSEKGFNVVENENIVTQEIDIKNSGDEDSRSDEKVGGIMEKSSDDDNTSPVLSTDSDKDDKKQLSLSNAVSAKQATKSKKSRKKRK